MPRPKSKQLVHEVTKGNDTYRVDDCVLLYPEEIGGESYVAQIKEIHKSDKKAELRVQWFYRPEDTAEQRKPFHGRNELYRSKHRDAVDVRSVIRKCRVVTFEDYLNFKEVDKDDYYWRFEYLPEQQTVANTHVSIYCVCGLPYNPDISMLYCEGCNDWFHPRCVGVDDDSIVKYEHEFYYCPECSTNLLSTGQPTETC